jgi:hypothetical protein
MRKSFVGGLENPGWLFVYRCFLDGANFFAGCDFFAGSVFLCGLAAVFGAVFFATGLPCGGGLT